MFGVSRKILQSQQAPLVVAAVVAGAGYYSFFSTSTKTPCLGAASEPTKTFGRGPAFKSLQLHSVEKLNHDTSRFRFSLPSEDAVSGLPLTATLLTVTRPNGQWRPVIRPYTPTSDLNEPGFLDLTVKRYPNGQASNHIHSLVPGDSLFILGTLRAYPWKQNEFSSITLIAGGAGITPIFQLIKGIFKDPAEKTKVTLLFGINRDEDALFREEFAKYEKDFPGRFKVVYTVTNPSPDTAFLKGRVSKELIKQNMPDSGVSNSKVFVCGPPAMEESLVGPRSNGGILGELGFTKDQIFRF